MKSTLRLSAALVTGVVFCAAFAGVQTEWEAMPSGTTLSLLGVWGASESDVFVVGTKGTILRYNGATYSAIPIDSEPHLVSVWGSAGNDVFAVGMAGAILHYDGTT